MGGWPACGRSRVQGAEAGHRPQALRVAGVLLRSVGLLAEHQVVTGPADRDAGLVAAELDPVAFLMCPSCLTSPHDLAKLQVMKVEECLIAGSQKCLQTKKRT
ncbi:hypothetical protein HNQ81_002392 [Desulfoprunum benzoelyticum]|uniref:Uncharacterized protein n=1 Tax=Desulfoprunum benzoelyticum TaxID=1506996 RepID=A0A840US83_9BACT|nr:hypothetical protein [Desulfoprunum benzoelyticum]